KSQVLARAKKAKINLRTDILGAVGVSLSERTSRADLITLFQVLTGSDSVLDIDTLDAEMAAANPAIPASMLRRDEILTHDNFRRYHSETDMMRYMQSLE
ncbi:glycine dehydrogenase (aminomethyl-transferring), partial [Enterobacter hormaechei]|nr:glycine dehydrogenase (aminomethyl-transferring) [Enterobacter hormaechei]